MNVHPTVVGKLCDGQECPSYFVLSVLNPASPGEPTSFARH